MNIALLLLCVGPAQVSSVDLSAHKPDSKVAIRQEGDKLRVQWPIAHGESGRIVFALQTNRPLIEEVAILKSGTASVLLQDVDPVTFVTVGSRDLKEGWEFGRSIFFSETYRQILTLDGVLRVSADALTTYVDGIAQPRCEDIPLAADELVWSSVHRLEVRYS